MEDICKNKNLEIQQHLQKEIENVKKGNSSKNLDQLNTILNELKKMLNSKNVPVCFPKIIVDSWDFQDKLGNELLEFEELYRRWR